MSLTSKAFRFGSDQFRALIALLALLLVLSTSVQAFAQGSCCPTATATAPCHSEVMAGCQTPCGICQVQAPLARGVVRLPNTLPEGRTLPDIAISDQLLAQPALRPPRG